MRLKDKVAIVTGGGRGIGRTYCLRLAQEGAKVVIADIDFEGARKTAEQIISSGKEALALKSDVADEKSVSEMARMAHEKFGKIDILVNNAALLATLKVKPWDQITIEEWDRVMAVNVRGVWLCSRAVFPYMKAQGKGKIINISSSMVFSGRMPILHYTTSKGAVIALTRALAREVGNFNINVNVVTPGLTETEHVKKTLPEEVLESETKIRCLKRRERPEDLAGTIVFLASDDSDFITGQTINVDGGDIFH